MKPEKKFLIDTDVIYDHITHKNDSGSSELIKIMQIGICFTTVINAAELLYSSENENQKNVILKVLNSFKVLGLNSRYALKISDLKTGTTTLRDTLILTVGVLNNLPIVTYQKSRYADVGIEILNPSEIGG